MFGYRFAGMDGREPNGRLKKCIAIRDDTKVWCLALQSGRKHKAVENIHLFSLALPHVALGL